MATSTWSAADSAAAPPSPGRIDLHPGWLLLRGVIAIVFGILAFAMPLAAIGSLVLLFAIYLLADGVVAFVAAVRAVRAHRAWGSAALEGVANVVAGLIALFWPGITLLALVWVSGLWAIVSGALLGYFGWQSAVRRGRWLRVLAGALSIVWGVLLLVAPLPGAVVMTYWLAAYAIVFGIALLVAGWRARQAMAAER